MQFNRTYNLESVKSLKDGPSKEALAQAQSLFKPLLDAAEAFRSLPEHTEERAAQGETILEPEPIRQRLDELRFAAEGAFQKRISDDGANFTQAEIGFMKQIDRAIIYMSSDPNSSRRRDMVSAVDSGKRSIGPGLSMAGKMERYNASDSSTRHERVRVGFKTQPAV